MAGATRARKAPTVAPKAAAAAPREPNDLQIITRIRGLVTRLSKAQGTEGKATRERALAITHLETAEMWLTRHADRNPDALV